jgi:hypothetical protein
MNLQETLDTWRANAAKIVAENENLTYVNYVLDNIDYEVLKKFIEDNGKLRFEHTTDNKFYTAGYETGFYWIMYTKPVEIKHTYEVINL